MASGQDAGTSDAPDSGDSSGCGCRTEPTSRGSSAALLALAIPIVLAKRRSGKNRKRANRSR